MAKETKLFSVQTEMRDLDYEDVYRIYLQEERGRDRRTAVIVCGILAAVFVLMTVLFHNFTFLIYAGGCLIVAGMYYLVPTNRKFLAQNKLQYGEKRETTFFPHHISTFELLDDEEELSEEEKQEATTEFSTGTMKAYENERGFLFADGKISNQFLYLAKRNLDEEEIESIRTFAKDRCSGGYLLLEMRTMLDGSDGAEDEDETRESTLVSGACDQYYGAKRLHLYDESGRRIKPEDEDGDAEAEYAADADDAQQESHTAVMDAPEMDVDAEWEKIVSEDADE
ncbi:MAG: hypothetical protein IKS42_11295 [Oscillospiraceae bacterium]|nr:hypothetical protein [Oscillospiraceae bacterium]